MVDSFLTQGGAAARDPCTHFRQGVVRILTVARMYEFNTPPSAVLRGSGYHDRG